MWTNRDAGRAKCRPVRFDSADCASDFQRIEQLVHFRGIAVEIVDRWRDEADQIELTLHHRCLGDPLARKLVALDRIGEGKAHRIVPAHLVGFDLVDLEQRSRGERPLKSIRQLSQEHMACQYPGAERRRTSIVVG